MSNMDGDILYSGNYLELTARISEETNSMGIEINSSKSLSPIYEYDAIIYLRNVLTDFLLENGYE